MNPVHVLMEAGMSESDAETSLAVLRERGMDFSGMEGLLPTARHMTFVERYGTDASRAAAVLYRWLHS